jgi:hypothetical protein
VSYKALWGSAGRGSNADILAAIEAAVQDGEASALFVVCALAAAVLRDGEGSIWHCLQDD